MGDFGCSFHAELIEEHVECSLGPSWPGPDETTGVVVDHHDQITVAPFV
jgi:hypothetical protein